MLALSWVSCSGPKLHSVTGDFSPDYGAPLPGELEFNIKHGREDSLIVHYFWGKLFVAEEVGSRTRAFNLEPSAQDWAEFWRSVQSVDIWNWGNGVDPGQSDYWLLRLKLGYHEISIDGTHFDRGLNGELSPKKEGWIVLTAAVQRLMHHDSVILRKSLQGP